MREEREEKNEKETRASQEDVRATIGTLTGTKENIMRCKICGRDLPEERFKAFPAKNGIRRMKSCNTCRARKDNLRKKGEEDALMKYSDIDLIYALQLRGYKLWWKKIT